MNLGANNCDQNVRLEWWERWRKGEEGLWIGVGWALIRTLALGCGIILRGLLSLLTPTHFLTFTPFPSSTLNLSYLSSYQIT